MTKLTSRAPLARPGQGAKDKEQQKQNAILNAAAAKRADLAESIIVAAVSQAGMDLAGFNAEDLAHMVDGAISLASAYVERMYGVTFKRKEDK